VCNHRYTALCDENNGAAVLNDCKYGVSVLENEISLTLLRAAACPHMRSDNGTQQFTYAFTAWEGSFYASPVVREGYELNIPPLTVQGSKPTMSYFWLEDDGNIILDTVKPAEDGSGDIVVRLYESKRAASSSVLNTSIPFNKATLTDMLENDIEEMQIEQAERQYSIKLQFKPFEVKTVRLNI
jgi:alpha-mannosidase